jgi:hypothetical protein
MPSSGMLRRLAPVRTDVSEELSASFIRVTRIGELGTTARITLSNISEDGIVLKIVITISPIVFHQYVLKYSFSLNLIGPISFSQ